MTRWSKGPPVPRRNDGGTPPHPSFVGFIQAKTNLKSMSYLLRMKRGRASQSASATPMITLNAICTIKNGRKAQRCGPQIFLQRTGLYDRGQLL